MADYFAMIRKIGDNVPRKLTFEAADTAGAAVNEMERRSGIKTSGMLEFELMKVVDSGRGYIPVAAKRAPKDEKRMAVITGDEDPVTDTPASNVSSTTDEAVEEEYNPYEVTAA